MIGREVIGRPEIFSQLINEKPNEKISFKNYLTLAEKYKLPFRQIKLQAMNFTKSKPNAKQLRLKIFKIKNLKDLGKLFK